MSNKYILNAEMIKKLEDAAKSVDDYIEKFEKDVEDTESKKIKILFESMQF